MRWGLGPVFLYECLANSRRWQTYAIRSAGVALLLAAIATIAMPNTTIDPRYGLQQYAALGESYFYGLIGVELTLVMLAAPAATAGAICVDRARRTLAHMLAKYPTELTEGGMESRVAALLLEKISSSEAGQLHLPMPKDKRLRKIFQSFMPVAS